jgi:hypothetical protein
VLARWEHRADVELLIPFNVDTLAPYILPPDDRAAAYTQRTLPIRIDSSTSPSILLFDPKI